MPILTEKVAREMDRILHVMECALAEGFGRSWTEQELQNTRFPKVTSEALQRMVSEGSLSVDLDRNIRHFFLKHNG